MDKPKKESEEKTMKKATGVVRKIDDLGRIVIPRELRNTMSINEGDGLEIFVDKGEIILKKYNPGCTFCNKFEELVEFGGTKVCKGCAKAILGK